MKIKDLQIHAIYLGESEYRTKYIWHIEYLNIKVRFWHNVFFSFITCFVHTTISMKHTFVLYNIVIIGMNRKSILLFQ